MYCVQPGRQVLANPVLGRRVIDKLVDLMPYPHGRVHLIIGQADVVEAPTLVLHPGRVRAEIITLRWSTMLRAASASDWDAAASRASGCLGQ